jgi:hypothetical protein
MRRASCIVLLAVCGLATSATRATAEESASTRIYSIALHSRSLEEQRTALLAIQKSPEVFLPHLRRSLEDYLQLLTRDPLAADRAAYMVALIGDSAAADALAAHLAKAETVDACIYTCAPVFALTIQARFRNWRIPSNLDRSAWTARDLEAGVRGIDAIELVEAPIETVAVGPFIDSNRHLLTGKSVADLVRMAGPDTKSTDERLIAALRLETIVTSSAHRLDLYLLAMNNLERDASQEYRFAVHEANFRAEKALALGR